MGYKPDATKGGLATISERAKRLKRAMDANTMRWLGAFLFASQENQTVPHFISNTLGGGFSIRRDPLQEKRQPPLTYESMEDHHHQACAVVENLIAQEVPTNRLGGSDPQNAK